MSRAVSLKSPKATYRTSGKSRDLWACNNPLPLTCIRHGDEIRVPCGRWRHCPGCGRRMSFKIRSRFLAGIEGKVPAGLGPRFFTLTFPESEAPDEAEAQRALRSLVRRLRYRELLGAYGWVLHRQRNGTLHFHGIMHLPWFDDGLALWRELVTKSGFGPIQNLRAARPEHAGYCARYISTRLAELGRLRRAYSFSRDFPLSEYEEGRRLTAEFMEGLEPVCDWMPSGSVRALLSR